MWSGKSLFALLACAALAAPGPVRALESDRQQPLEVNADTTDGTLGDGVTTLRGHVEVRQGTLFIQADEAEVDKAEGKVRKITLRGETAYLQQEIEEQGLVKARAKLIEYEVANGMVVFTGAAEVEHPQYEVSGDQLRYDLNAQHFEGVGDEAGQGRIRIRLDPEVINGEQQPAADASGGQPDDPAGEEAEPEPGCNP